jgi:hypothetical protein
LSSDAVSDTTVPVQNVCVDSNTVTTSDHFLVTFQLPVVLYSNNKKDQESEYRETRALDKIDIDKFRDLFCSPLINFGEFESVDQAVQLYNDVVQSVVDKHAPLTTKKYNPTRSPWWDSKCQNAKCEVRKAFRKLKKNPTDDDAKVAYNEKCVDKAIIVDRARNLFYDQKLCSVKGDSRGTYKVINHLLDKEYGANKLPNGVSDEIVAEKLKSFFDKKVKTIYSKIEEELATSYVVINNDSTSHNNMTHKDNAPEMQDFNEISIEDLKDIILDLPNKSCMQTACSMLDVYIGLYMAF